MAESLGFFYFPFSAPAMMKCLHCRPSTLWVGTKTPRVVASINGIHTQLSGGEESLTLKDKVGGSWSSDSVVAAYSIQ